MAKYEQSIYTPNMSGKVGGFVFSRNRYGAYQKVKPVPRNPRSDFQKNVRTLMSTLSKTWKTLTDAQRTIWDNRAIDYPFSGKTYSGFTFFMKLNRNLQDIGQAILLDVPQRLAETIGISTFTVDIVTTSGTEDIKLNISPAIGTSEKMKIFATAPLAEGKKIKESQYREIGTLDHTFVSGGSIKTQYMAKFQEMPITGVKASFRVQKVATASGLAGAKFYATSVGSV